MQANGSVKSIICGMMAVERIIARNIIPGIKMVLNFIAKSIMCGMMALVAATDNIIFKG